MTSRETRSRWRALFWIVPAALVVAAAAVYAARWLRTLPEVTAFLAQYPGVATSLPGPVGLPLWVAVLHFLNAFFMLLIVKSGWAVRTTRRPSGYWSRGRVRISLDLWLHYAIDSLWIVCGLVFVVLTFATGHWVRIVPTDLDVLPNALSAGLQYVSFDWPTESGWTAYNALQLIAYFATVFIAAPLALATGFRMSAFWPSRPRLDRVFPIAVARRLHFPVMLYFVLFTIVHVTLVLATGAVRNLNHMFAARDDDGPLGIVLFAAALVAMAASIVLTRPIFLRPVASLTGSVSR